MTSNLRDTTYSEPGADHTDEGQDDDSDIHRGRVLFVVRGDGLYHKDEGRPSRRWRLGVEHEIVEAE